jgi:type II secretory pathway component PulF
MKLAYQAHDSKGRQVSDTVEAPSVAEATEALHRKGLFITEIHPESAQAGGRPAFDLGRGRRLKSLAMFMRQLHVLVASGTPVVEGLAALERQVKANDWREMIAQIRQNVEEGRSLSESMSAHPRYFDPVCISLVEAGESGGNLSPMLDRLANLTRRRLHVRNSVIGAIIYPSLLLVTAMVVMSMLLTLVVPRFAILFETLDVPLPASTEVLVGLGEFLGDYWWAVLAPAAVLFVALKLWFTTATGKRVWDTIVLRLPQIGRITKSFATAQIVRLLGILLKSRVPLLDALQLTRASTTNSHYTDLVAKAEEAVIRGESISSAFEDSSLVTPSVYEAIRNGEQSGRVGDLMLHVADFLDEDNELLVKSLTSILEPVILILLGVLVGFVALSMFTPLFDLTAMTQGGGG